MHEYLYVCVCIYVFNKNNAMKQDDYTGDNFNRLILTDADCQNMTDELHAIQLLLDLYVSSIKNN